MRLALTVLAACGGTAPPPAKPIANTAPPAAPASRTNLAITELQPTMGDVDGGTYVVLHGKGFVADGPRQAKIWFGNRAGAVIRFANDSELIVEAPGGKVGESVDVLVVFEPGGEIKIPHAFTFVEKRDVQISP